MKLSKAASIWIDYHKNHSKKKIRYDPTKPSLSHFAKRLVKGRSVRLRQMRFYLS